MKAYNWATEDIYQSQKDWEEDFSKASEMTDFSEFKGKLCEKQGFIACMKKQEKISRIIDKLSVYAYMKHDENTADANGDALLSRVMSLSTKVSENSAFILPELTALDENILRSFISDKDLSEYDYFLKEILNQK